MIYEYMNYNAESDFFAFPDVKWLHLTGGVDKSVRYSCQFFYDLTYRKLSNSVIFDRVIQKIKRWTFWGHRAYRDLINVDCAPKK